jgi:hypothetical protein
MPVEKATVLLVLKRLALSRSTYKLVGLLLLAFGLGSGLEVAAWTERVVCMAVGTCGE